MGIREQFKNVTIVAVCAFASNAAGAQATVNEVLPGASLWDYVDTISPAAPYPTGADGRNLDIVAALQTGNYVQGPYAAIRHGGWGPDWMDDEQTSIIYSPDTGEIAVNAPASKNLTSVSIDSASGIFVGLENAENLDGTFDSNSDNNIFKVTIGSSFGSLSFGNVAQTQLTSHFVANDLTVIGSLEGGGGLGDVDLIYVVPEPSTWRLATMGLCILAAFAIARAAANLDEDPEL